MHYRKILILGGRFSGKSWLAHSMADVTGIDTWDVTGDAADAHATLAAALSHDAWIVASQAPDAEGETLAQADLIVFMRTPLWLRALRLLRGLVTSRASWRRSPGRGSGRGAGGPLPPASKVFVCRSSEDVRRLLEGVMGLQTVEARGRTEPSS